MAKQIFSGNYKNFSEISNYINQFLPNSDYVELDQEVTFTSAGSYVLNACISGTLFGGTPSGHCIIIAGDPKTGKSYIVLDAVRELQKDGYMVIIFDTEHAHTKERYLAQGVDINMIKFIIPDTVNQITSQMVQLTQSLFDTKEKINQENKKLPVDQRKELPKIAVVIDSISTLNSEKQLNDALEGNMKSDMGSLAKELKVMYNLLIPRFGKLGIPLVCTAHTYEADEGYQKVKKLSGGKGSLYMPSVVVNLRKKFDRDEDKQKTGIIVTAEIMESRFSMHRPVSFYISFTRGINRFLGLEEFISWDVCGITKGKMVDYINIAQEIFGKKAIDTSDWLNNKYSTKLVLSSLSSNKKDSFQPSFEEDIENGYIVFDSNEEQIIQLPDLILFLQSCGHNVNLEFDTIFLKEKMQLNNIFSEQSLVKWVQNSIKNDDVFVMGNAKVDVNKIQKFKFKKPILDAVNSSKYKSKDFSYVNESTSDNVRYNSKLDQSFKFTQKFVDEMIVDGIINKVEKKVCKPQESSNQYCVKHLNRCVDFSQLFNKTVFTDEVLKQIDEKMIKPLFQYRTEFIDDSAEVLTDDSAAEFDDSVSDFESQMNSILDKSK